MPHSTDDGHAAGPPLPTGENSPSRVGVGQTLMFAGLLAFLAMYAVPYSRPIAMIMAIAIVTLIHLVTIAGTLSLVGGVWTQFQLFAGGALVRLSFREHWFALGWLPIGGYVKPLGWDLESSASIPALAGSYATLSSLRRIAVAAAGPVALFLFAVLTLGPADAAGTIADGPASALRVFSDALITLDKRAEAGGKPALQQFVQRLDSGLTAELLGVVSATTAWLNLLPLPATNGGVIVGELARSAGFTTKSSGVDAWGGPAILLIAFGTVGAFFLALARAW